MKTITKEWLNKASEDLLTISRIINDPALTGVCAFHAEQAIEKRLKAVLEESGQDYPRTHNLEKLFAMTASIIRLKIDSEILRYPGDLGLLPEGNPSLTKASLFYETAKTVYNTAMKALK